MEVIPGAPPGARVDPLPTGREDPLPFPLHGFFGMLASEVPGYLDLALPAPEPAAVGFLSGLKMVAHAVFETAWQGTVRCLSPFPR